MVSDIGERSELHHGTGTLNGVHDSENFIYVICGEIPYLFICDKHFVQLIQERFRLQEIGVQHSFHCTIHSFTTFSYLLNCVLFHSSILVIYRQNPYCHKAKLENAEKKHCPFGSASIPISSIKGRKTQYSRKVRKHPFFLKSSFSSSYHPMEKGLEALRCCHKSS